VVATATRPQEKREKREYVRKEGPIVLDGALREREHDDPFYQTYDVGDQNLETVLGSLVTWCPALGCYGRTRVRVTIEALSED
jgi:hypothetical protein